MEHALDLHRGHGGALEAREKHTAKRVAKCHAKTTLERLGDENCLAARIASSLTLKRVGLLQFLPVLRIDGHFLSLAERGAASRNLLCLVSFLDPIVAEALQPRRPDQTRRRFEGRTPLCGIEVTSRIEVIWKPTA